MTPLLLYALKVILCSSLLMGYYYGALRNKVFHQWNRFYLLLTVVLSLMLPLAKFTLFSQPDDSNAAIQLLQTINGSGEEWVVVAGTKETASFNWQLLASVAYGGVSLLLLVVMVCSVIRLFSLVRRHTVQEVEDIHFINTDVPGTPFSFLRYIFWNRSIDVNSATGKQILKHELVHVREWHTADKLFLQVVLVLAWFNPIFWIIRHEIKMIHEFIADNKAVQGRDASELAAMILQAAYPAQFNHLVNPFFHQSIKRRLRMLTKIQNPRVNYISRVLILPLLALTVFLFSARIAAQKAAAPLSKKMIVVIDAGHGAKNGAYEGVRVNGLYEDQLTLAIAQQVKALNTDPNLQIVLTREGDERVDLHQRVDKTVAAGADLFVSIHINAKPNVKTASTLKGQGVEIYLSNKNTTYADQSLRLASAITQSLQGLGLGKPNVAKRQMGIWVLDQAPCPAVLLECGYLTDAKDLAFISNKANQKAVAQKLLESISTYVNAPETITEAPVMKAENIKTVEVKGAKIIATDKNGRTADLSPFVPLDPAKGRNITDSLSKMLMIVDGRRVAYKDLNNEDPSNIKHITVLRGVDAMVKYGEAGRYGAMEISTKGAGNEAIVVQGHPLQDSATGQKISGNLTVSGTAEKRIYAGDVVVTGRAIKSSDDFQQTFTKVEEEARFPDENGGWKKFLSTNLNAEVPGTKGAPAGMYKVVVRLLIAKDGTIEEILPLTNQGFGTEEEVARALKLSPKWIPAKQNGKVVRSYHEQPITFVISE